MKNLKLIALLFAIMTVCNSLKMYGQATSAGPGNTPFTAQDYNGWANGTLALGVLTVPELTIKNEDPMPIGFYTGAGAGTYNNMRMRILANYNGNGLIGIGDMGTGAAPFTPQNLLHIHRALNDVNVYAQFTSLSTGITNTNGFLVGIRNDNTFPDFTGWNLAELRQQVDAPLVIATADNQGVTDRIYVHHDDMGGFSIVPLTRVGIAENTPFHETGTPRSLLHLGFSYGWALGGHRNWMDVGTFCHAGTDICYMGLKVEPWSAGLWNDNMDAVVAWGDNINGPDGADNLRFIFSAVQVPASQTAGGFNGLEVGRFSPLGRFGFGNFTLPTAGDGSGIPPARHVEIYDEHLDDFLHTAAPQLRLTYEPNALVGLGIHTDFQNTSIGNLIIVTENAGVIANTGIGNFHSIGGTIEPKRRLDLLDQGANLPQLRLTHTADAATANGIWTDFQTTFRGDLYINPSVNGTNRRVGINRDDPRTTLEINSNGNIATNPRSGLQFTDMTNASPRSATNGGVLSLDPSGEVIFVDDIGGGNISSSCGSLPTNYITKATGSSSICKSDIYENSLNDVGIGTTYPLNAKLNIKKTVSSGWVSGLLIETDGITNVTGCASKQTSGTNPISFLSEITNSSSGTTNKSCYSSISASTSSNNVGFETHLLNTTGTTPNTVVNYGFKASIGGAVQSSYSYGFHVQSYYANHNYGVWADAIPSTGINVDAVSCGGHYDGGTSNSGTSVVTAIGVEAYAHGGSTANYGVSGKCNSSAADNYAIYGEVIQPNSGFNNYAGYFVGNVFATGVVSWSDQKLKTNINPISNGLSIINQLKPKTFDYQTANFPSMNLPTDNHPGLIAQDVELVLPTLVKAARQPAVVDSNGLVVNAAVDFKGINYPELIPYLIAAIQEQQIQMDSLSAIVLALSNGNPLTPKLANPSAVEVKLSNQNKIILNQNDPNPFAENTTINYFIPDNVNDAQLLFYDNTGTILKTVDIKEKGQGSILIYGSNLSSGVYTYTLLADGKGMETKRMVKIK